MNCCLGASEDEEAPRRPHQKRFRKPPQCGHKYAMNECSYCRCRLEKHHRHKIQKENIPCICNICCKYHESQRKDKKESSTMYKINKADNQSDDDQLSFNIQATGNNYYQRFTSRISALIIGASSFIEPIGQYTQQDKDPDEIPLNYIEPEDEVQKNAEDSSYHSLNIAIPSLCRLGAHKLGRN